MSDFNISYKTVMAIEGGYVNNPSDKGGETYKGISRKNFPAWTGWLLVDAGKGRKNFEAYLAGNGTLQTAVEVFYKDTFWNRMHLSEIENQSIALELFDTGVHMGQTTAVMFVQRALNLLNRNGKDYPDTNVDGLMGRKTIDLVNNHKTPRRVYDLLNTMQGARYIAICEKDKTQEQFMYSWLSRVY
jgi:lysozyme family protein